MNLVNYETVPGGYGQIRFYPLQLANYTNTLLEEWFINYKFLHFCLNKAGAEEFLHHHLTIEFTYSRRQRVRTFDDIRTDVTKFVDRSLFQELFRIMVITLEKANELYEVSKVRKTGRTIFDLRKDIETKNREFHRAKFPDKIKKFKVKENFHTFIEALIAVNKARNCYEHRNGLLGAEDCNSGRRLLLSFRFPAPVSQSGKTVGVFGHMPIGSKFVNQFVDEKKTFRVGQNIDLSFDDSYKLIYTINFALKGIVDHIYESCGVQEQTWILKQFKT
jgi:hypothetical protein